MLGMCKYSVPRHVFCALIGWDNDLFFTIKVCVSVKTLPLKILNGREREQVCVGRDMYVCVREVLSTFF